MARLALRIFCVRICINDRSLLRTPGPVLIIANHPNSFLDAVIIGASFNSPVHYLARGDAFKKPWHGTMLRLLNMIPVYRLSEGKENLSLNEVAFRRSAGVLSRRGTVLIFIEGICKHTHELQPFKKGAARIAMDSRELTDFRIMPAGLAYNSFTRIGKKVNLNLGAASGVKSLLPFTEESKNLRYFNDTLAGMISNLIAVPKHEVKISWITKTALFFPAVAGILLHFPLYTLLRHFIRAKTAGTVFYDSVMFGALLLVYPVYLVILMMIVYSWQIHTGIILLIVFAHPLTAWAAIWWKRAGVTYTTKK